MPVQLPRDSLPFAARDFEGSLPIDARDPEARFRADHAASPSRGGTECAGYFAGRHGVRRVQRLRRTVQHSNGRAAGGTGAEVQPLPHHRVVCTDSCRAAHWPQPPHGGDGRHHRVGHLGARLHLGDAQHLRAVGADPAPQRLLDCPVRQMPRSAGLADEPDGTIRRLADRRWRLRALLWLHRG